MPCYVLCVDFRHRKSRRSSVKCARALAPLHAALVETNDAMTAVLKAKQRALRKRALAT